MNKIGVLLIIILIGFVIVALPDSDTRLFSISKDQGPSLQDAVGLILVLFSYTLLAIEAWKQKEKVLKYKNSVAFKTGLFLFGIGHGLILASVINDYKYWWVYGIILLVSLQIVVFYIALKKDG
jgi:magnesium-transporting ATPase (P-type)